MKAHFIVLLGLLTFVNLPTSAPAGLRSEKELEEFDESQAAGVASRFVEAIAKATISELQVEGAEVETIQKNVASRVKAEEEAYRNILSGMGAKLRTITAEADRQIYVARFVAASRKTIR